MFYGISKNKNGKAIPDFEKYKPWAKEEYSGKISYILDNNEEYEIFREFKKKTPIIYDKEKNDWIIVTPTKRAIKLIDSFMK